MTRLLCIGDLAADLAITITDDLAVGSDTDGTIAMYGGGSAANVAAWAARSGLPTRFVGAVGDDPLGEFLTHDLADHGVEVLPIRRAGQRSRAVAAIVGPSGERSLVSDLSSEVAPAIADFDPIWFDDVTWLHLTAYTLFAERSRGLFSLLTTFAAQHRIPYSIDPSAAQLLAATGTAAAARSAFEGARVLFPNHDEASWLTGTDDPREATEHLLDIADCVATTCGADGAWIATRAGDTFHADASSATLVNSLGCGDAFAGGFIAGCQQGMDARASPRAAVELAGDACGIPSAR